AALTLALALAGIGIGITVTPVTSAALGAAPAARSGMAASAINTSREMGAVTGVAILGALVTSRLSADLTGELQRLGVPLSYKSLIVNAIETGQTQIPTAFAGYKKTIEELFNAADGAFGSGLHAALYLAAAL